MLGAHALMLVALAIAGSLGWWQLTAWQDRRAAEARDLTSADPVPLTDLFGPDDPFPGADVGQPVEVVGTWLPEGTVLVGGRRQDDVDGYWVVSLLSVGDPEAPAIPVVRGWQPDATVRPAPTGTADLVGYLQPADSGGEIDTDPADDVFPELRVADLAQRAERDLYSGYVITDVPRTLAATGADADAEVPSSAGLTPADLAARPEVGRFTALRNLLYALEWWVFGGFAAYIWWRFVRDERHPVTPADPVPSTV